MAWWTWIALRTREREPQAGVRSTSTSHGVWLARTGMIAVFSLPLFAAWSLMESSVPQRIRIFRLTLTLGGALLMGIMVFVRQRLLDAELLRLLTYSRDSLDNLKHLQSQITESEKLASIGQLVGGAAHELNNPITAMLGYSDLLLLSQPLTAQQTDLAAKIGQQARRTKSLVASLLSFAKPTPAALGSVDLNTLLRTAVKLSQPQWQALHIEVRSELPQSQLQVRGDSNQLLQVCVQVVNDALHAAERRGGRLLKIDAQRKDGFAMINLKVNLANAEEILAKPEGPSTAEDLGSSATSWRGAEPSATYSSLGLSACQGILMQHRGKILWQEEDSGEISVRIEIPLLTPAAEKSNTAERAAAQPLPFA
jgi:two-component system NtrC family sensor kinase